MWAERLMNGEINVNNEAVLIAAAFHDIGYALCEDNNQHAESSAIICEQYLKQNGYKADFIDLVLYLVKNHSCKQLLSQADAPLELIILMEADILDETGVLSIVWDCMIEGAEDVQSYEKTYGHILDYTFKDMSANPMVTPLAKSYWEDKQRLTNEFVQQLGFDLGR